MPMSLLAGDGNEYRARLLDGGLFLAPGRKARELLRVYLPEHATRDASAVRGAHRLAWRDRPLPQRDRDRGRLVRECGPALLWQLAPDSSVFFGFRWADTWSCRWRVGRCPLDRSNVHREEHGTPGGWLRAGWRRAERVRSIMAEYCERVGGHGGTSQRSSFILGRTRPDGRAGSGSRRPVRQRPPSNGRPSCETQSVGRRISSKSIRGGLHSYFLEATGRFSEDP